ncbi:hypothetical protein AB0E63_27335 [Kribbella sp. NPDC026596]|uniref:hypothetical protein n=1 Tax=Kribbella sp. NPDC026596 TaxID=3155122 RepID=UPI0033CED26F
MDEFTVWVPTACTLPAAEQPLRVAEFDQLFANHLRSAARVDPHTLDLVLTPESRPTAEALTTKETECCSFFTFDFTNTPAGNLRLRITVPPTQTAVLDALTERLPA